MKYKAIISAMVVWTAPLMAFAVITTACDIVKIISSLASVFAYLVFVIGIASILYAGLLFIISGGNEQKVSQARNALIWGLIGIAVALFSNYAIDFVQAIVGGATPSSCP